MTSNDPASLIRHYAYDSDPDQRTSMADSRIALCLARGVAMDDIDPASGYDYSRAAYDRCRHSWVWNIKEHGYSESYDSPALNRAIDSWAAHRPDFLEGDDWLAAGLAAHRAHWATIDITCSFDGVCDICTTGDEHAKVEGLEADGRTPGEVWEATGLARCDACGHLMRSLAPMNLIDHYCARRQRHGATA
ncbi:hypothetical protein V2S66_31290 [Streptomyces sp. V4-01]|uniref:Uncharacterized protein n=1 Tax=Actinacidiphila polyblastidii TaxID=3110430 RepID=A0ABU7PKS5_9ACTN|nr:hypothetical protein [Streptomyces sp. V4-01]